MKKLIVSIATLTIILANTACGTIWGGRLTECQKQKPKDGSTREIRPVALIGDLLFFPVISLIVDFADGGVYKPCNASPADKK
jgi:hypothetical protein